MQELVYVERPAPADLAPYVRRTWYLAGPRVRRYEKILPLPYVHVICTLSDAPYRILDGGTGLVEVPRAFCSGVQPAYLVVEDPEPLANAGIELAPAGLRAFSHLDPADVTGRVQDADPVLPGIRALAEGIRGSRDAEGVLDALEALLRAARRPDVAPDPLVAAALAAIEADDGPATVSALAAGLGVSHRTLIARFRRSCGIAPKAYADVWRFHRLVTTLPIGGPMPTWAEIAQRHRYYDQPHVTHAFTRFTGMTPAEYLRRVAQFGPDAAAFVPLDEVETAASRISKTAPAPPP